MDGMGNLELICDAFGRMLAFGFAGGSSSW